MLGTRFLENTNKSLFHKGDIFPLNISTESQRKVMIIEVETNPWIQKQQDSLISPMDTALLKRNPLTMLTIPVLNGFTFINKQKKEIQYSPAIIIDFLRTIILEDQFHSQKVYTATICKDEVRNAQNLSNDALNCNPYLVRMLGPQFLKYLKELGINADDILVKNAINESGSAEIYLPFASYNVVSIIKYTLNVEYFE